MYHSYVNERQCSELHMVGKIGEAKMAENQTDACTQGDKRLLSNHVTQSLGAELDMLSLLV